MGNAFIHSIDFDGATTGFATLSSTDNFNSGAWGMAGNGYWVGRDAAYATSNTWSDTDDGGYGNDWNEVFYVRGVDLNNTDSAKMTFNVRYDMDNQIRLLRKPFQSSRVVSII